MSKKKFILVLLNELSLVKGAATMLAILSITIPLIDISLAGVIGQILTVMVSNQNKQSPSLVFTILGVFLFLSFLKALLTAAQLKIGYQLDAKIAAKVRLGLLSNLLTNRDADNAPPLTSISMHLQALSKFWSVMFWETLAAIFFMIGACIALIMINAKLALIAFLPIPVVMALVLILGPRFRRSMEKYVSGMDAVGSDLLEVFENRDFIKVSGIKTRVAQQFQINNRRVTRRARDFGFWTALYAPIFDFIGAIAIALIVSGFAYLATQGSIGVETFFMFFAFLSYLYRPIYGISSLNESWQKAFSAYQSLNFSFNDMKQLSPSRSSAALDGDFATPLANQDPHAEGGSIVFESVKFSFDPESPLLRGVDVVLPGYKASGIIGGNGRGKSTLIKIILGLLKPQAGVVKLDVRSPRFAYLPQSVFLNSTSVLDNLLIVHPNFSVGMNPQQRSAVVREILDVGEEVGVLSKLGSVDLQTPLGGGKNILSGGQKQLIGLWRFAIQSQFSDYLIMDEPDAYLDIDGLSVVLPRILQFVKGRTLVMVSHNAKLTEQCDALFKLDDGVLRMV